MLNMRVMLVDGESVIFQRRGNVWTPERSDGMGRFRPSAVISGAI